MINKIINEISSIIFFILNNLPGTIGSHIRRLIYKKLFKKLGVKFISFTGLIISYPKSIEIGNNCSFMRNCSINACSNSSIKIGNNISVNQNVDINSSGNEGRIEIGDNVLIGNNVVIRASDHDIKNKDKNIAESGHLGGSIVIENNVWIGANSVILKNVKIEEGAVIGAGTVVSKNVAANDVVVSSSQKIIKNRFN